jgi:hypothetical protein
MLYPSDAMSLSPKANRLTKGDIDGGFEIIPAAEVTRPPARAQSIHSDMPMSS